MATATKSPIDPSKEIATLRIELIGSDPLIWREVEVLTAMRFSDLHDVVQVAMGWENEHLWDLSVGNQVYDCDVESGRPDPYSIGLKQVLRPRRTVIDYTYDFGDSWRHQLTVTRIRAAEVGKGYPNYVAGERACPPEDCGGIWRFQELLDILSDKTHPEHTAQIEWMGDYDPAHIDEEYIRTMLARVPAPPSEEELKAAAAASRSNEADELDDQRVIALLSNALAGLNVAPKPKRRG